MVYLLTFTIKSTKCRWIYHTWILWDRLLGQSIPSWLLRPSGVVKRVYSWWNAGRWQFVWGTVQPKLTQKAISMYQKGANISKTWIDLSVFFLHVTNPMIQFVTFFSPCFWRSLFFNLWVRITWAHNPKKGTNAELPALGWNNLWSETFGDTSRDIYRSSHGRHNPRDPKVDSHNLVMSRSQGVFEFWSKKTHGPLNGDWYYIYLHKKHKRYH